MPHCKPSRCNATSKRSPIYASFPPTVLTVSGSRVKALQPNLSRMRPAPRRLICFATGFIIAKKRDLSRIYTSHLGTATCPVCMTHPGFAYAEMGAETEIFSEIGKSKMYFGTFYKYLPLSADPALHFLCIPQAVLLLTEKIQKDIILITKLWLRPERMWLY